MRRYVLSVLVQNTSGVLSKVTGLFSRRGYNIRSLSVGETHDPKVSRITIEMVGDESVLEQIQKQLDKLVDVITIKGLRSSSSVYKELILVKVKAPDKKRANIIELCDIFRTKIVDIGKETMIIELSGSPEKNKALMDLLAEYGIIEVARTGITALQRGESSLHDA
ncbi:MAG: acetolactate synthase small subunit [Christensenella sp.]|uniref:acetolactate synthase small subunit n=1 Tax=Christensenella sp. TaxID=1935934 RepID=UPI002B20244A|nr:acetolactate synthase small subunit [Christensenella sp.]MEA5003266.1 acetolactate synthase small subunit [Christensenella sp.]